MKLSAGKIALIVVGVILVIGVIFGVSTYNTLVKERETVVTQQANIDTYLQRRTDLIPNLINTVKGYVAHEEKVFKDVSDARAKLAGAASMSDKATANGELDGALSRLLAISESYPALKADTQFTALQDELAGTENRIATARKDYNAAVQTYNQKRQTFPTVLLANIFGFSPATYFQAAAGAEAVPTVTF